MVNSEKSQATTYQRGITLITPSSEWREALPSGNGVIGAMVYGSIGTERILFNHNALWFGGTRSELPDMSAELPKVREMMLAGEYGPANMHYVNKMIEKGFNGKHAAYHPAFDMLLTMEREQLFEDYIRSLDFETGEVKVQWKDGELSYSRRLFVSIPDDITVLSLKANSKGAINGAVTLDIHDLRDAVYMNGKQFDPEFTFETIIDGDFVEFRADGSDGGEFGGVVRVIAKNGITGEKEGQRMHFSSRKTGKFITFDGADELVLLVGIYANESGNKAVPRLRKRLESLDADYERLFSRHKDLHSELFNRVSVNINEGGTINTPNEKLLLDAYQNRASKELIQKLVDYGRYLLISSSKKGGYPANLQGIWNGDYAPPWYGHLGNNENLQMNYWQAMPGNLNESMMAFFDYFDSNIESFRYNAKQLWGCRGIYIPPFMVPANPVTVENQAHTINYTEAAGWLASFYYDYYLFTGDENFLRNRAVPFMKEVALFYEDFIVKDENGKNMFLPSESPENQPAEMVWFNPETKRNESIRIQINSTMAVAISKEVFMNLISACELLDIEQKGVVRWKKMVDDMPAYEVNEDGAMKEWLHPDFSDNYEHRHESHVYPVFPGHEVTFESNPEIYEACRIAIEKRKTIGLKAQTGWSLAHMSNVYARLGQGDKAKEALDILTRSCLGKNFFTYHNDSRFMGVTGSGLWGKSPPFQMDANFGITSALYEMLCGSNANMLRILPALPSNWKTGDFSNMLTRVGVRVSASWNMDKKEVMINLEAIRDADFIIKFPRELASLTVNQSDKLGNSSYGDTYKAIRLSKGERLELKANLN
ncbi:glycoside hydrolase family 95 protein [Seonamhaeicola sp. MEBiC1930]|uniref:glycoside hydrolase family 95 protein n=1 Tax=Seonamhaeicola sp. MEBiC01930 TaxID=2976768 RepID=UPI003244FA56